MSTEYKFLDKGNAGTATELGSNDWDLIILAITGETSGIPPWIFRTLNGVGFADNVFYLETPTTQSKVLFRTVANDTDVNMWMPELTEGDNTLIIDTIPNTFLAKNTFEKEISMKQTSTPPLPPVGEVVVWLDSPTELKMMDSGGNIFLFGTTGVGEANIGANIGTAGEGVYDSKSAATLNFRKLNPLSSNISIVFDDPNNKIDFNVPNASTTVKGVVELATDGEAAAGVAVQGNDARMSNARTPTAHASTHHLGNSDPIKLDDLSTPDDNTDLNASTTRHGLLLKLDNDTTHYLRGDGAWQVIPDGSTTVKGIVELATDGENAANVVVQGNDARLSDSRVPTAHAATHLSNGSDAIAQASTTVRGTVELATDGESAANLVPQANDARLSNARTPTAHQSTHLSNGSDPIAIATTTVRGTVELATDGENAANVVVQGNDARLSNARTPTSHGSTHLSDGSDPIAVATTTVRGTVELATDGENAANVVVQGNDARLSNARTPTAHKSSHVSGGGDAFAKGDDLVAAMMYLQDIADPASDAQRIWIEDGTDNLKYWSDEGTPIKHTVATLEAANVFITQQRLKDNANSTVVILDRDLNTVGTSIEMVFEGQDSLGNATNYGRVNARIVSNADGTEEGELRFASRIAGVLTTAMELDEVGDLEIGPNLRVRLTETGQTAQHTFAFPDLSTTLVGTTDARLSDARTPTAHNTSHQSGGGDAIKLDDLAAPDDNTDLNASTSAHGLMMKFPGGTTDFLRADGAFAAPPGAGGGESNTASNVGTGDGWWKDKSGVDLRFKSLIVTTKLGVTNNVNDLTLTVNEANIKLDDLGAPDDNTDLDASTTKHGLMMKFPGGSTNFLREDGTWQAPPGGGGGEANTASNLGAGQGVWKDKSGVDLRFRSITATSSKIALANNTNDIGIDVTEANLTHDNIGGTLGISKGGTGQTAQTAAFDALSPLTTTGDIIKYNGTDNVRVARGTALQVLRVNSGGTDIEYATLNSETTGTASGSANGSATSFNIAHSLGSTPYMAFVQVSSVLGSNIDFSFTYDSTNIVVVFATAPATGTITFQWRAVL